MVGQIMKRGITALQSKGLEIDREAWMNVAEATERAGSVVTCRAIIGNTIEIGVEEEYRKRTLVVDAGECKKRGSIETARTIYAHVLSVFYEVQDAQWILESLDALLGEVAEVLGAKEKWLAGDVPAQEAYAAIPQNPELWLVAVSS
jgi:pre-mRNA-processing factor 6